MHSCVVLVYVSVYSILKEYLWLEVAWRPLKQKVVVLGVLCVCNARHLRATLARWYHDTVE